VGSETKMWYVMISHDFFSFTTVIAGNASTSPHPIQPPLNFIRTNVKIVQGFPLPTTSLDNTDYSLAPVQGATFIAFFSFKSEMELRDRVRMNSLTTMVLNVRSAYPLDAALHASTTHSHTAQ
jgi:hypothetical protein